MYKVLSKNLRGGYGFDLRLKLLNPEGQTTTVILTNTPIMLPQLTGAWIEYEHNALKLDGRVIATRQQDGRFACKSNDEFYRATREYWRQK